MSFDVRESKHSDAQLLGARCERCGAQSKLILSMLDARKGQSIRIYECRCGQQTWTTNSE